MPPSEKIRNLKFVYENGPDNIGKDFVKPCLEECVLYRRGSGFFSSSALLAYVDALEAIIDGKTKVQIVCSPVVQDHSVLEILERNLTDEQRERTISDLCDDIFEIAIGFRRDPEKRDYRQKLLAYFVATGALEIRFAVPVNFSSIAVQRDGDGASRNLYHVKKGYFVFDDESIVGFSGSFNESESGHEHHIEDTQVWKSWLDSDMPRLDHVRKTVDADWEGLNRYLRTFKMSERALEIAKKMSPLARPKRNTGGVGDKGEAIAPKGITLRDYQERALNSWKMNNYRGILSMATGTGKTKTAIEALMRFRSAAINGLAIVTVPTRPLAYQWTSELQSLGIPTISIFEDKNDWDAKVVNLIQRYKRGGIKTSDEPVLVCVNRSFQSDYFQSILASTTQFRMSGMIVCDECHHFNNARALKFLPTNFDYRIGLSATPYESDEPHLMERFFGGIVFEFSLAEAIQNRFLAQYRYHPILIQLSEAEAARYSEISSRIIARRSASSGRSQEPTGDYLELDHILENTVAKLTELDRLLEASGPRPHTLFYCGTGYVNFTETERLRQLDTLARLLSSRNWKISKITCDEKPAERESILRSFVQKSIDGIVSIRVLDEGIDIPDCQTAYILASQRSERQGIQRRGRILRKSETKEVADLYDFIIVGPHSTERSLEDLYGKELRRAKMFSLDAINSVECLNRLSTI